MVRKTKAAADAAKTTTEVTMDAQAVAAQSTEPTDQHATDSGQPAPVGAQPEALADTVILLENVEAHEEPITAVAPPQAEPVSEVVASVAVVGMVTQLIPIPGADFIEQAIVDCGDAGEWSGVVAKGIGTGGLVTVFLQDALLPDNDPRWDFMSRHKFRVRMARFKGIPSECVIIPGAPNKPLGFDLMEALGVTKYSKPLPSEMQGAAKGNFPPFIPKTDETNFQRVRGLQALMDGTDWYVTVKADGTSCTAYVDDQGLHVCSRNLELKEFDDEGAGNLYWRTARKYGLEALESGLALQFEIIGPSVQANPMGLADIEIRVFTGFDIQTQKRLPWSELADVCSELKLPMASLVREGSGSLAVDELRDLSEITYPNGKPGEGVVIRSQDSSWSFKVINLKYID